MKAIPQIPQLSLETRVDKIKMAVLKVMVMNNRLYKHLYSSTFDVPDYEKQNILYNNETLYLQYQQYFTFDFDNPDFEFHRRQLDTQILCNRKIHEIVRNTREIYADICSPLYNKRKFISAKVFPNASQLNLPKTLPMTSLCDHLLSVYHYMYDPLIEDVMLSTVDELIETLQISVQTEIPEPDQLVEKTQTSKPIDIPAYVETSQVSRPAELPILVQDLEKSLVSQSTEQVAESSKLSKPIEIPELVQLDETSEPTETTKPVQLVETLEISKPIETYKPVQLAEKSNSSEPTDILEPVKLVETPKISKTIDTPITVQLVEAPKISKPLETHKPAQLVEKPTISKPIETPKTSKPIDTPKPVQLVETEISKPLEINKPFQLVEASTISKSAEIYKPAQLGETPTVYKSKEELSVTQKPVSEVPATYIDKQKPAGEVVLQNSKTTIKSTRAVTKEVKAAKKRPREYLADTVTEKRKRDTEGPELTDFLRSNAKEEITLKHKRIAQWIQACVPKSAGAKRKASLVNKAGKDHAAKRQKMTQETPKSTVKKRVKTAKKKKSNIK